VEPNEERLIAYAIDLGTEVEAKAKNPPSRITKVSLQKGLLYSTTKLREERTYHAVNRSPNDRSLLVEHPYRPEFHLATDLKPAERTRNLYRFEVKVPAGKTGDLEVVEGRDLVQSVTLTNSDEQQIRFFLQQQVLSAAVRQALEKAVSLRGAIGGAVVANDVRQLEHRAHGTGLRVAASPSGAGGRAGSGCPRSCGSRPGRSGRWLPAGHGRAGLG
jgi:hypothetical protein